MALRLRLGLSSCFFHPDPERALFKGKTLLYVEQSMVHWVARSGALVYPIPTSRADPGAATPADYVADLDGLVLHGGADVSPRSYGEAPRDTEWAGDQSRDDYELELLQLFLEVDKPVLGICRGLQILNVACGGSLHQDLGADGATDQVHRSQELYDANTHTIDVVEGSGLASLVGTGPHLVNSIHHQGISEVGSGLLVEARSTADGVVEAVRLDGDRFAVGVQWHPEFFDDQDESLLDNTPILGEFVERARRRAEF